MGDPALYREMAPRVQMMVNQIRQQYPRGYQFSDEMIDGMTRQMLGDGGDAIPAAAMMDPTRGGGGRPQRPGNRPPNRPNRPPSRPPNRPNRPPNRDRDRRFNFGRALLLAALLNGGYYRYPFYYPYYPFFPYR